MNVTTQQAVIMPHPILGKLVRFLAALILSTVIMHLSASMAHALDKTLQWDSNSQADYYIIYYGTSSGNYTSSTTQIPASQTQYTLSNLSSTTYYCAIKAFNNYGNSSDYSDEISFFPGSQSSPLSVSISSPGAYASIDEDQSVNFQALVSGGTAPLTYSWNFGVGGPSGSSVEDPGNVTFPDPGIYTVTLTVTDAGGNSASATAIVTVTQLYVDMVPTAQITSPSANTTITAGGSVNFQGNVLNGNPTFSYSWSFGNGGPAIQTVEDPGNVTFPTAGTYVVTFTVTDNDGDVSSASRTITVNPVDVNPTASISSPSANTTITAGGSVNFQGTVASGNSPFTYAWKFGTSGPASSSVEDPGNVTFPTAGTYTVTFTVTDSDGDTSTATRTITVNAPDVNPTASITSPSVNTTITAGDSVNFQGTVASGNAPFTYSWNFGTGGPASKSVEDPGSVTFPTAGTYVVTFTVTDSDGDTSSATRTITVNAPYVDVNPTASITSPTSNVTITAGESVNFQGTVASGNAPFTYSWTFGNGGPAAKSVEDPGSVTFPTAGTYTVTFTVTDNDNDVSTASVVVTVQVPYVDVDPTASISSPNGDVTITEGASVNFQGTVVSGNAPFTHAWTFGNSGVAAKSVEDPGNVAFPTAGTYTVVYTVTDNDGDVSSASINVTVEKPYIDTNPTAFMTSPVSNVTITEGGSVNFQGSVDSGNAPFTYAWNFGTGGPASQSVANPGNVTFPKAGTYTVTYTVTDNDSDVSTSTRTVTVLAPVVDAIPVSTITSPASDITIEQGGSVTFQGNVSSGDAPLSYTWNFADSGIAASTSLNPGAMTFNTAGTYKVTFTATDSDKDTSSASVTVTVTAPAPVVVEQPTAVSPANQAEVTTTPELVTDSATNSGTTTTTDSEWQISTTPTFTNVVFHATTRSNNRSLSVPTMVLNGKTTYYWRMKQKSSKAISDWSEPAAFVTASETWNDNNGNGVPDDQDVATFTDLNKDGIADNEQPDTIKVVKSASGNATLGIVKLSNATDIELLNASDDTLIADNTNKPTRMNMGLMGFRIVTQNPGDTVMIGIYLSSPAPAGAGWYKYDSVNGWQDYSSHAAFSQDRKMVTVQLTDGGEGDADGIANGVIVDPAGVGEMTAAVDTTATTGDTSSSSGGGSGCFITATDDVSGGYGMAAVLMLTIIGIAMIRPSGRKSVK